MYLKYSLQSLLIIWFICYHILIFLIYPASGIRSILLYQASVMTYFSLYLLTVFDWQIDGYVLCLNISIWEQISISIVSTLSFMQDLQNCYCTGNDDDPMVTTDIDPRTDDWIQYLLS